MLWDITWEPRSEEDGGGYYVIAKGLDGSRRPGSKVILQVSPIIAKTMTERFDLSVLSGKVESYLEQELFKGNLAAGQAISVDEKLAKKILEY